MDAPDWQTRWRNAFIYALVTTIMVLSSATVLSAVLGAQQRALADRVDHNSAVTVCILRLGVNPRAPQRTDENVNHCISDPTWVP